MYYHIYLYHGNKYNYHCVITQTLQNGQTLGQFFELLYSMSAAFRSSIANERATQGHSEAIFIPLDHVSIAKIHLTPAATMRRMFCKFCPQGPLDICKKYLPVLFKWFVLQNGKCYKVFFTSGCNLQYYIVKRLITISISKKIFWVFIFG